MARVLDKVESPQDLKRLSFDELNQLAYEIKAFILETVSKTGGHLASNLGVVELTLALHYVFNSPRDKIIWDVGHQCYTHKIITGRKKLFPRLRCLDGILGFPCRLESEHDVFNTGHASTSLSAALGMAVARDKFGGDYQIIAVVGDGSLTGGVAWEAINQIGQIRSPLIIILNYNAMSISPSVGGMSKYLSYLASGQHYLRMKDQAKSVLKKFSKVGQRMITVGRSIEELIKRTFFPGLVFEELGIRYIGPVHGHNIRSLVEAFEQARKYDRPILIHCVTQKGHGYPPARKFPDKFHSAGPFEIKTGKTLNGNHPPSFSTVFGQSMLKAGIKDKKILAITAAMGEGTGLNEFAEKFPDRFYDVGIAEQHAVNFAAGLANAGLKPVVAIYSTFLQRAYDQIYHDVCLMDLPVVFALDRAGIVADDGPTHQGINDLAYLRQMPNMIIMAPKDENELQHMIWSALSYGHPVAVRFPKANGVGVLVEEELRVIPLGQSELLKDGEDLLIAFGHLVGPALEAASQLEKDGISLAVVNARFVRPLDEELILKYALPGKTIITVEEGIISGGAGSAVRELLDQKNLFNLRFKIIGIPQQIYPNGKAEEIRRWFGLDSAGLKKQILDFYRI